LRRRQVRSLPPDTLKAKTDISAAEADTLRQEAEALPAEEGNLPAEEAEEIMIEEPESPALPGDGEDTARITIGEIVTVEDTGDETVIRIGKKAVRILTDGDNAEIRMEDEEEDADEEFSTPGRRLFEGHLGGIEIGFNSYSTGQWGRNPEMADDYLDLNTAKSSNFNIISPPVSLGLSRHHRYRVVPRVSASTTTALTTTTRSSRETAGSWNHIILLME